MRFNCGPSGDVICYIGDSKATATTSPATPTADPPPTPSLATFAAITTTTHLHPTTARPDSLYPHRAHMQALYALHAPSPLVAMRACRRPRPTVCNAHTKSSDVPNTTLLNATSYRPADRLFESVLRDNIQFYLAYATMTVERDVMGKGFHLGGIHIRPTDDVIEGYIPYLLLLRQIHARRTPFTLRGSDGVRIAGYKFRLRLELNKTLPATVPCHITYREKFLVGEK